MNIKCLLSGRIPKICWLPQGKFWWNGHMWILCLNFVVIGHLWAMVYYVFSYLSIVYEMFVIARYVLAICAISVMNSQISASVHVLFSKFRIFLFYNNFVHLIVRILHCLLETSIYNIKHKQIHIYAMYVKNTILSIYNFHYCISYCGCSPKRNCFLKQKIKFRNLEKNIVLV